jgi:hypothetical protein
VLDGLCQAGLDRSHVLCTPLKTGMLCLGLCAQHVMLWDTPRVIPPTAAYTTHACLLSPVPYMHMLILLSCVFCCIHYLLWCHAQL